MKRTFEPAWSPARCAWGRALRSARCSARCSSRKGNIGSISAARAGLSGSAVSIRDAGSRSSFTSIENKVDNEARKKAEKEAEELYENEEEDVDEAEATEEGLEIKELQEDEDIIE